MGVLRVKVDGVWYDIVGPQGPQGTVGATGPQGPQGIQGPPGAAWAVGAWTNPTLTNSWVGPVNTFQTARYRKIGDMVYIEGQLKNGTINTPAFTLPAGFRPLLIQTFVSVSNAAIAYFTVADTGLVTPVAGSTASFNFNCCFSTI